MSEDTNSRPQRANRKKRSPRPARPQLEADSNAPRPKAKANSKRSVNPKKPKKKEVKNDYRYLEIIKLIKIYKPITINGVALTTIIEKADTAKKEADSTSQESSEETSNNSETNTMDPIQTHIAKLISEGSAMYLLLAFTPSDPDFPFDLDILKISLCVPPKYPYDSLLQPSIYVLNDDIPRGFAVNIEIGFRTIAALVASKNVAPNPEMEGFVPTKGRGLLAQIQSLDKNLEYFLKQEKKDTIKFIKGTKKSSKSKPSSNSQTPASSSISPLPSPSPSPAPVAQVTVAKTSSKKGANPIRDSLVHAFTGKIETKLFRSNDQESVYKLLLPITGASDNTPNAWSSQKNIDLLLHIPTSYPEDKAWSKIPAQMLNKIATKKPSSGIVSPTEIERSAKEALRERLVLSTAAKNFEINFKQIPHVISAAQSDLVTLVNFAANNFGLLCLDAKECSAAFNMLK